MHRGVISRHATAHPKCMETPVNAELLLLLLLLTRVGCGLLLILSTERN
jgi:hypothetical protein|eukprot:SAG25_NODE_641_length_6226_cov_185.137914_3_plen_49_part_00